MNIDDIQFDEVQAVTATPVPSIQDKIELAVLAIEPVTQLEELQMTWTLLDSLKRFCKEAEDKLKPRTIEWIKANGEFMIGDERYYVGQEKETKCIDVKGAAMALLGATGEIVDPATGEVLDFDRLTDCMSSNAFKPATSVKALAGSADKFFRTEEKSKLKRDNTERSELRKINTAFIR
jgi:hypothetical protein